MLLAIIAHKEHINRRALMVSSYKVHVVPVI